MTQVSTSSDTCLLLYTLLLDYLVFLVSFLTSQPIHSAYLLFFSPYLLPLVSFLSPLLLSTSILLLLLSLHWRHNAPEPNAAGAASLLDQLGSAANALIGNVFEWEFETMQEVYNSSVGLNREGGDPADIFLDTSEKEPSEPEGTSDTGYRAKDVAAEAESLQRDGSMRKEKKEWKRTLACKLYEERRMTFEPCEDGTVVDGTEEMDLLWEAYEVDSTENAKKEEEEEEEEEEMVNLCCLQALKLSTGKMHMEKISKVFKGIGLFRRRSGRRSRKDESGVED